LAFHSTMGCSNGPTEAVNLLIKSAWNAGSGPRVSWVTHGAPREEPYRKEPAAMAQIAHTGPIHLGLDVHRNTISVATLPPDRASAEVEQIPSDEAAVLAFVGRFAEPGRLRVCADAQVDVDVAEADTARKVTRRGRSLPSTAGPSPESRSA
jgi:hypothetical protein